MKLVLDTFALLKWLLEEKGYEEIETHFRENQVLMSSINFGEAFYMLLKRGLKKEAYTLWMNREILPIRFFEPTWKRIKEAALIKASYPLSYADAFCVALAIEMKAPVLTGDPEFKKVKEIELLWIGE